MKKLPSKDKIKPFTFTIFFKIQNHWNHFLKCTCLSLTEISLTQSILQSQKFHPLIHIMLLVNWAHTMEPSSSCTLPLTKFLLWSEYNWQTCFNHNRKLILVFGTLKTSCITFYTGHSCVIQYIVTVFQSFSKLKSSVKFRNTRAHDFPQSNRITVSPTKLISRALPKNNGWETEGATSFTALLWYFPSSNPHRWRYETEPGEGNMCVYYSSK